MSSNSEQPWSLRGPTSSSNLIREKIYTNWQSGLQKSLTPSKVPSNRRTENSRKENKASSDDLRAFLTLKRRMFNLTTHDLNMDSNNLNKITSLRSESSKSSHIQENVIANKPFGHESNEDSIQQKFNDDINASHCAPGPIESMGNLHTLVSETFLSQAINKDLKAETHAWDLYNYKIPKKTVVEKCSMSSKTTTNLSQKQKKVTAQHCHIFNRKPIVSNTTDNSVCNNSTDKSAIGNYGGKNHPKDSKVRTELSCKANLFHLNKKPPSLEKSETFSSSCEHATQKCGRSNGDGRITSKKLCPSLNLAKDSGTHPNSNEKRQSVRAEKNKCMSLMLPKHGISMKRTFKHKIPSPKVSKVEDNLCHKIIQHGPLEQVEQKTKCFIPSLERESNNHKESVAGKKKEVSSVKTLKSLATSVLENNVLPRVSIKRLSSKLIANFGTASSTSPKKPSLTEQLRERSTISIEADFYGSAFSNIKIPKGVTLIKCVVTLERSSSLLLGGEKIAMPKFHNIITKSSSSKADMSAHESSSGTPAVSELSSMKNSTGENLSTGLLYKVEDTYLSNQLNGCNQVSTFPISSEHTVKNCGQTKDNDISFKNKFASSDLSKELVTHADFNGNRQSQSIEITPSLISEDGGNMKSAFVYKIPPIKISKGDSNIWQIFQHQPSDQTAPETDKLLSPPEAEANIHTETDTTDINEVISSREPKLSAILTLDRDDFSRENAEKCSPKLISNFGTTASIENEQSSSEGQSREKSNRELIRELYGSAFSNIKIPIGVTLKRCNVTIQRVSSSLSDKRRVMPEFHNFSTKSSSSKAGESSHCNSSKERAMSEFGNVKRSTHAKSHTKFSQKAEKMHLSKRPGKFKKCEYFPVLSEYSVPKWEKRSRNNEISSDKMFPCLDLSEKPVTDVDLKQTHNNNKKYYTYKIPPIAISKANGNIWKVKQHQPMDSAVSKLGDSLPMPETESNSGKYDAPNSNDVSSKSASKLLSAWGLDEKVVPQEIVEEWALNLTSTLDDLKLLIKLQNPANNLQEDSCTKDKKTET
ncbi:uncharacterized protein [Bemisia tabaci]